MLKWGLGLPVQGSFLMEKAMGPLQNRKHLNKNSKVKMSLELHSVSWELDVAFCLLDVD